jgi:hypothetical protein
MMLDGLQFRRWKKAGCLKEESEEKANRRDRSHFKAKQQSSLSSTVGCGSLAGSCSSRLQCGEVHKAVRACGSAGSLGPAVLKQEERAFTNERRWGDRKATLGSWLNSVVLDQASHCIPMNQKEKIVILVRFEVDEFIDSECDESRFSHV